MYICIYIYIDKKPFQVDYYNSVLIANCTLIVIGSQIEIAKVMIVHQNATRCWIVKAHQQRQHRALAASRFTHKRKDLQQM